MEELPVFESRVSLLWWKVITRGIALKGTLDRYRAIGSPVRATNSQSP
jgi:hypothetical protein